MSGSPPRLILASASHSRAELLRSAGIPFETDPAGVDEEAVKSALKAENAPPFAIAETLAELKAMQVAPRHPGGLVIGADQVLECGGELFDKPRDMDHARAHLATLRGRGHTLHASVSVVRDTEVLWHYNESALMTMRDFSDTFLDWYLAQAGEEICRSVGAYQIEGIGLQLFSAIDGDQNTIRGLPLLPLLDFLRNHGIVPV